MGFQAVSSYPHPGQCPCKSKEQHGLSRGMEGGQEGQERQDWFPQRPSPQPAKPLARNPGCPCHPTDFFIYRRPQASPAPWEGWIRQKRDYPLGVCPGSNSQHPLNRDPWPCPAPAPTPAPKHPNTNAATPQITGGRLRVWPPNLLALPPLSCAGEGVARQGKGNMQVATHPSGSSL